jgi:hypothetical protein
MAKRGRRRGSRKQNQNQNQNQNGGAGAAEHAIAVFGNAGAQNAVPNTNLIAMNNPSVPLVAQSGGALVALTPAQAGGALHPLTPAQLNGGNVLNDIAVPATFLLANSVFKKRRSSKRASKRAFGRRRRGSSRRR